MVHLYRTNMALTVWTQDSGYAFGTLTERRKVDINLPVTGDEGVTYTVISGKLPPGLRITQPTLTAPGKLVGTPYEVARDTEFKFCIRASKNGEISDRTFTATVTGADAPSFLTPSGDLDIGPYRQYFVLDSTFVDYQIEAVDFDTGAGQQLHYYIADGDGELPPGLVLTQDGRLVGFIEPVTSIKPADGDGTYDNSYYDAFAYDFAYRPTNGYDSYIYDNVFYDFALASGTPRKLNRNYEFIISVTDGDVTPLTTTTDGVTTFVSKRKFNIFVVGDDYFRADNTTWLDGSGLFTADVTYLRAPIWITPSNLGMYRSNNYVTLKLDTYDTENILYDLEYVNADVIAYTDQVLPSDNVVGSNTLTIHQASAAPIVGQFVNFAGKVENLSDQYYLVGSVTSLGNNVYRLGLLEPNAGGSISLEATIPDNTRILIGSKSILPPGMSFDTATSEVYGAVPYQPAITTTYTFTVNARRITDKNETANTPRIFTVQIIGEVDSTIEWVSPSALGSINANFISMLFVKATTTVPAATLLYRVTNGTLPPGLTLDLDGEIVGKVNQYAINNNPGLTTFDFATGSTTFDNKNTTIDRVFTFTVEARDQYNFSASSKQFTILIETPNEIVYSNIRVQPYLKLDQRSYWKDFINNTGIFTPESIYRPNDANFGLQTSLSMIVYAGIETTEAAAYIGAIGLNHKKKRFAWGSVKKAVAIEPGTTNQIYEVIYVEMIDLLEPNGNKLPNKLTNLGMRPDGITIDSSTVFWQGGLGNVYDSEGNIINGTDLDALDQLAVPAPRSERPEPIITVDSQGYFASNINPNTYFPSSISNWRRNLRSGYKIVSSTEVQLANERNYLPLWMRSIQPGTKEEVDFKLAVPLCYCKVGTGADILLNIKYSGFDFKLLDYTADRYIIDSVQGETGDKYLVFRNDRITV